MTVSVTVSLSLGIFTIVVVELVSFVAPSHAGQRDSAVFRWLLALVSSLCLCCLPPLALSVSSHTPPPTSLER